MDKKNESEGQAWSQGKVKIPKASMFKVSLKHVSHQSVTLKVDDVDAIGIDEGIT